MPKNDNLVPGKTYWVIDGEIKELVFKGKYRHCFFDFTNKDNTLISISISCPIFCFKTNALEFLLSQAKENLDAAKKEYERIKKELKLERKK